MSVADLELNDWLELIHSALGDVATALEESNKINREHLVLVKESMERTRQANELIAHRIAQAYAEEETSGGPRHRN